MASAQRPDAGSTASRPASRAASAPAAAALAAGALPSISVSDTCSCVSPSMLCATMSLTEGTSVRRSVSALCLMNTAADDGRILSDSGSLAGITTCTRALITPSIVCSVRDSSCDRPWM
jgi:hypothetical protein